MKKAKMRKFKIYQEDAKQRQVSHWDWDYMTTSEIDLQMGETERYAGVGRIVKSCIKRILCSLPIRHPRQ